MNIGLGEYLELLLKIDESFETKFSRVSTIKSLLTGAKNFLEEILNWNFKNKKT